MSPTNINLNKNLSKVKKGWDNDFQLHLALANRNAYPKHTSQIQTPWLLEL